jgi:hypothetical protein
MRTLFSGLPYSEVSQAGGVSQLFHEDICPMISLIIYISLCIMFIFSKLYLKFIFSKGNDDFVVLRHSRIIYSD